MLEIAPHQQRVVEEKAALDEKIEKLTAFVQGDRFADVPEDEQRRLAIQLNLMNAYALVLCQRIVHFQL